MQVSYKARTLSYLITILEPTLYQYKFHLSEGVHTIQKLMERMIARRVELARHTVLTIDRDIAAKAIEEASELLGLKSPIMSDHFLQVRQAIRREEGQSIELDCVECPYEDGVFEAFLKTVLDRGEYLTYLADNLLSLIKRKAADVSKIDSAFCPDQVVFDFTKDELDFMAADGCQNVKDFDALVNKAFAYLDAFDSNIVGKDY